MKAFFAALLISASTPALAQDRMEADACRQSWDAGFGLSGWSDAQLQIEVDPAGWCHIQEGTININALARLRIDSLKWRASEIDRLVENGLPPRSLEIYGEGLRVLPQTGDAVYDYLFGLQNAEAQIGFGLSVRWDGVQNAVLVDEGFVVFDETNRVDLTARIDGLDLTDQATIQSSVGTMGLRSLSVKADFDGWFESYLALPIGVAMLTGVDTTPQQQVADLQRQSTEFINEFPEAILPEVGRDALGEFITALPEPRGTFQMQLNADPVIGALNLAPLGFAQTTQDRIDILPNVLEGVRVLVTWSPTRE